MIDIAKKKLPSPVIALIVYVSYCMASWFSMRGTLAYYGQQMGLPSGLANDAIAFFLGGVIPFAIYEALATMLFKPLFMRLGGDVRSLKYGLNYALIAANVLLFALKFIYLAVPLYATLLDTILDPIITVAFVALYMWYAFYQNYVDKSRYGFALVRVLGAFIVFYGLLAILNLLLTVA